METLYLIITLVAVCGIMIFRQSMMYREIDSLSKENKHLWIVARASSREEWKDNIKAANDIRCQRLL